MYSHLISPHGGSLINLIAPEERAEELRAKSWDWSSWDLTIRQLCDLELLMNGGFSPLTGFLNQRDYESVCQKMRLGDGSLWPIPITLDVPEKVAKGLDSGSILVLRDLEGVMLAVLHVEEVWKPDLAEEAELIYGTANPEHIGITHPWYVGGRVEGVELPRHYDFRELRLTPAELRERFASLGWRRVVAFQTQSPMHRAHHEFTSQTARELGANLLIQLIVEPAKSGDIEHYTWVRCCQAMLNHYRRNTAILNLLTLARQPKGPREVLWHAIVQKNYGCTHFIVEEYPEQEEIFFDNQDELAIQIVPFKTMVYVEERDEYLLEDEVPKGAKVKRLSETELKERLAKGIEIPSWFSFPDVIRELKNVYPPRSRQGFTVFFTGLPSAGKSTIANVLRTKLLEMGERPVTLLDGDIVRKHLSQELGFSRKDRNINISRIGFVASEITKNGGIAICAPIAPYDNIRKEVRKMIEPKGGFFLVYVATPLEVCEQRDRKGLYAKARAGIIKEFTGISDPYEEPADAEIRIDTTEMTPEECAQEILLILEREGYIGPNAKT
jgi:sulfate adenylyltransferase